MQNLLLIEPPFQRFMGFSKFFFPLALGYLATYVNAQGYPARVYDAEYDPDGQSFEFSRKIELYQRYLDALGADTHPVWQAVRRRLAETAPDVVGISVYSEKVGSALKVAALCKQVNPACQVVLGGAHASIVPDRLMADTNVDFVVVGEGERALLGLLQALDGRHTMDAVPNLVYRRQGAVVHNPSGDIVADLDGIPYPDRALLMEQDVYRPDDNSIIMTSRGCPFACSYCYNPSRRHVRWRSIDNVIEEIKAVKAQFNPRRFYFKDDSFSLRRERVETFCRRLIAEKIDIRWECLTRVDLMDESLLVLMLDAGLEVLKVGVESGSPAILKAVNKKISLDQFRRAARLFNRHDLFWSTFFMIGLPYETEADIALTKQFMQALAPKFISMSLFTPYPQTADFDYLVRHNMASLDMDWNLYDPHSPHTHFTRFIDKDRFDRIAADVFQTVDDYNRRQKNIMAKTA